MRGNVEESLLAIARRELRAAARRFVAYDLLVGEADNAAAAEAALVDAARNYAAVLDEDALPTRRRRRK